MGVLQLSLKFFLLTNNLRAVPVLSTHKDSGMVTSRVLQVSQAGFVTVSTLHIRKWGSRQGTCIDAANMQRGCLVIPPLLSTALT